LKDLVKQSECLSETPSAAEDGCKVMASSQSVRMLRTERVVIISHQTPEHLFCFEHSPKPAIGKSEISPCKEPRRKHPCAGRGARRHNVF
jgi:hypothetical protein